MARPPRAVGSTLSRRLRRRAQSCLAFTLIFAAAIAVGVMVLEYLSTDLPPAMPPYEDPRRMLEVPARWSEQVATSTLFGYFEAACVVGIVALGSWVIATRPRPAPQPAGPRAAAPIVPKPQGARGRTLPKVRFQDHTAKPATGTAKPATGTAFAEALNEALSVLKAKKRAVTAQADIEARGHPADHAAGSFRDFARAVTAAAVSEDAASSCSGVDPAPQAIFQAQPLAPPPLKNTRQGVSGRAAHAAEEAHGSSARQAYVSLSSMSTENFASPDAKSPPPVQHTVSSGSLAAEALKSMRGQPLAQDVVEDVRLGKVPVNVVKCRLGDAHGNAEKHANGSCCSMGPDAESAPTERALNEALDKAKNGMRKQQVRFAPPDAKSSSADTYFAHFTAPDAKSPPAQRSLSKALDWAAARGDLAAEAPKSDKVAACKDVIEDVAHMAQAIGNGRDDKAEHYYLTPEVKSHGSDARSSSPWANRSNRTQWALSQALDGAEVTRHTPQRPRGQPAFDTLKGSNFDVSGRAGESSVRARVALGLMLDDAEGKGNRVNWCEDGTPLAQAIREAAAAMDKAAGHSPVAMLSPRAWRASSRGRAASPSFAGEASSSASAVGLKRLAAMTV